MSETDEKQSNNQLVFWLIIIAAAMIAYLLSPGPVVKVLEIFFKDHSSSIGPSVRSLYAPILWSMDNIDWVDSLYTWYLRDLWGVH